MGYVVPPNKRLQPEAYAKHVKQQAAFYAFANWVFLLCFIMMISTAMMVAWERFLK